MDIFSAVESITHATPINELHKILDAIQTLEMESFKILLPKAVRKARRILDHPVFKCDKLLLLVRMAQEEYSKFIFDSPVEALWLLMPYRPDRSEPLAWFPQHQCYPRHPYECRIRKGYICGDCKAEVPKPILFQVTLLNNGRDLSNCSSWNYDNFPFGLGL